MRNFHTKYGVEIKRIYMENGRSVMVRSFFMHKKTGAEAPGVYVGKEKLFPYSSYEFLDERVCGMSEL